MTKTERKKHEKILQGYYWVSIKIKGFDAFPAMSKECDIDDDNLYLIDENGDFGHSYPLSDVVYIVGITTPYF